MLRLGALLGVPVLLLSLGGAVQATGATSVRAAHDGGWYTAWAESQQDAAPSPLRNQSVRSLTHLSQGGDAVRIRIQNQFGTEPLEIARGAVALSDGTGPAVRGGTGHTLTFHGDRSVTVPVGGEAWSDPVGLGTEPEADLAVSLYVPGTARPGRHISAFRDNYLTPAGSGDHVRDTDGAAFTQTVGSTYLVSAVDVHNPRLRGTVVAYGSSVVDGTGSTNCGPGCTTSGNNQRWTDDLARRVTGELTAHQQFTLANAGIGGTTSSEECPSEPAGVVGLEAAPRLGRDVLALHGVTGVIFFYGTNDLADGCTSAQIIDSYRQVFTRLHGEGIKVYVVPSTPRPSYTDQMNRYRWDVGMYASNQGSCGGACDGVIDFDQVIKDPVHPNSINRVYDNGDGIHVNVAGQQAEADTISLPLLLASTRH
ncbi:GDSL-type esterase/lipase family protein [Streptomyces sp. NPDC051320]|uniref:GDSL-type esterase/lipase family protein n=1 Tax=Streptomyces sp. NPDC051320 TaxID=3154644 RepID=UPI003440F7E0